MLRLLTFLLALSLFNYGWAQRVYEEDGVLKINSKGLIKSYVLSNELRNVPEYVIRIPVDEFIQDPELRGNGESGGVTDANISGKMEINHNVVMQRAAEIGGRVLDRPDVDNSDPRGEYVATLLEQAINLIKINKYKEALKHLQDAEKADKKNYKVKTMMGSLYFKLGMIKDANRFWNESIIINPYQPRIREFLKNSQVTTSATVEGDAIDSDSDDSLAVPKE